MHVADFIDFIVHFFNSNFFSSVMSSTFGAVGGAQAVKMVEKLNRRYKDISIINADLVLLSNTLSKLLGLKKMVMRLSQETMKLKQNGNEHIQNNQEALFTIIKPHFADFDKVFSFVYEHATVHYMSVVMCGRLIESLDELAQAVTERNEVLSEVYRNNPNILDKLVELTESLKIKVDNSLFYTYYAFKEFRNLVLRVLPTRLHKNIVVLDIQQHDKKLIPPYNFIKGFYLSSGE